MLNFMIFKIYLEFPVQDISRSGQNHISKVVSIEGE